jgi:hypothetical protein
LHSKNDFAVAERCASELIKVLDTLSDVAEKTVNEKWEDRLKEAENLESAGVKLLEKRIAGEVSCEYRRLREHFISYVHAWFAQLAILASGTGKDLLPNPEVMEVWFNKEENAKIRPREVFHMLTEAEELVRSLRTNVNDELALRAFMLNAAFH